jgi:IS5 family transposase
MRPNPIPTPADGETDMFRNRLDAMIDMRHELVRLAALIEWKRFDEAFGGLYAEKGRPGLATRLMVGLHLIKHARGVSDEQVCAQWIENAYFQFFCGETYFQTKLPLDRTSMSVWRGRIGAEKLELLLAETLAAATRAKAVDPSQMQRVTVDTTAQTKAVAHPTDSHLLLRAVEWLNRCGPGPADWRATSNARSRDSPICAMPANRGSNGSSNSWRRSPTTNTRFTRCMRPRSNASPRARRAHAMNSG